MMHALIMAGGGGTRFWPRSRKAQPKQFLALTGDRSLLQLAYDRLEACVAQSNIWVMTADRHRDKVIAQLPGLDITHVIGEPAGRDTAPCIGLAAALIEKTDPGAVMLVSPADHVIEPTAVFHRSVRSAAMAVEQYPAGLVTFGIRPTYAATGFGYIRRGERLAEFAGVPVNRVAQFREKPDAQTAAQFVADGGYFWNSGIFVWKASTLLAELRRNKPALAHGIDQIAQSWNSPRWESTFRELYPTLERISIDYAVMEPSQSALVLEAPFAWDDVGSWLALERMHPQDNAGNTVVATHTGISTENCVIVGQADKLIATAGVRDLIIVQDGDAILIADRNDEAALKQLVERIGNSNLDRFA